MPDILAHFMIGKKVHEYLHELGLGGDEAARITSRAIDQYHELFLFGTQGPDVFYYHNFWPWKRKRSLSKLGNRLHVEKTGAFFIEGLKKLHAMDSSGNDYQAIWAYFCGYLCHFTLDKNAHPYIYRMAGFSFEKGEEKGDDSYQHQKLEALIDCMLWKRFKNKEACEEPIHLHLQINQDFPLSLDRFYRQIIRKIYGLELKEDSLKKAFQDMNAGVKLIFDPNHHKKRFFTALGTLRRKEIRLPRPLYPRSQEIRMDYLNEKRMRWVHPLDENEEFSSSFLDILEESKTEAVTYILQGAAYLRGEQGTIQEVFKDISYLTNKEWGTEAAWRKVAGEGIISKY